MSSPVFKKAEKLFWHDRVVERLFLWIFPDWIYPNHITIFRFILTPFVFFLIYEKLYLLALPLFLIVAFTDVLDGSLARTRNQITDWGISYDPIADKILIGGAVLILVTDHLGYLIPCVIIGLEFFIVANAYSRRRRGKNIQANVWGKLKMFFHVTGVAILIFGTMLNVGTLFVVATAVLWLAVFFATLSLLTGRL